VDPAAVGTVTLLVAGVDPETAAGAAIRTVTPMTRKRRRRCILDTS
jgi:hypothetical protein